LIASAYAERVIASRCPEISDVFSLILETIAGLEPRVAQWEDRHMPEPTGLLLAAEAGTSLQ
jgi:hypothetical protein